MFCLHDLQVYTYEEVHPDGSHAAAQRDLVYHNGQLISMNESATSPELERAIQIRDEITSLDCGDHHPSNSDFDYALTKYLLEKGASEGTSTILQAIVTQELAAPMSCCSVYEVCRHYNAWTAGTDNYRCWIAYTK